MGEKHVCTLLAALSLALVAPAATLIRSPYLQNVGPGRASILWTTLERGQGAVACSSSANATTVVRAPAPSREFNGAVTGIGFTYHQYQADLTGLSANLVYRCGVTVDGVSLDLPQGVELSFSTSGPGPLGFLVFGDSGTGSEVQRLLAVRMEHEKASLVLHTGDIVYPNGGYAEQQAFYFDAYRRLMARMPFFPSLGNHDYETQNGAPYFAAHSLPTETVPPNARGRYYSFDWGNVHFVSLDTNPPTAGSPKALDEMLDWLENDLANSRAFWRIVYFHNPPFASGHHENSPGSVMVRSRIVPILDRYNVPLVFSGHEHSYQRTFPMRGGEPAYSGSGTVYITTGGGGAALYPVPPRPAIAFSQSEHHFIRVDVEGSQLRLTALNATGRVVDQYTLAPPPQLPTGAIVNSASFAPDLAPGSLITIFGHHLADEGLVAPFPLPTSLADVTVEINGRPLPLLYLSATQINTQLPFDLQGPVTLRINTRNGTSDAPVTISGAAPAIFFVSYDGELAPLIMHADGTLISAGSPAAPGERISIDLTGLGQVNGTIAAGQRTPDNPPLAVRVPVEVQIGGATVTALVARLLPGVAGVYRVEVELPHTLTPGRHVVRVLAGNEGSNTAMLNIR
jgi:acid phosphatase type 7